MSKEKVYEAAYKVLDETVGTVWDYDKPEDKANLCYFACGVLDTVRAIIQEVDE